MTMPWLIGVARHKLADHYRRGQNRFAVPVADLPEAKEPRDDWDAELDRDERTDKLDFLIAEAREDRKHGRLRDWPAPE